jgi:hypothetical protein
LGCARGAAGDRLGVASRRASEEEGWPVTRPTMNGLLPCPSPSALRRHWAQAVICPICEPDAERPVRCPACTATVVAVGDVLAAHVGPVPGWECRLSRQPIGEAA